MRKMHCKIYLFDIIVTFKFVNFYMYKNRLVLRKSGISEDFKNFKFVNQYYVL